MRALMFKRVLLTVPVFALAAGAVTLGAGLATSGGSDLPTVSPGRAAVKVDTNSITPDGLSPALTARDWKETSATFSTPSAPSKTGGPFK